MIWGASPRLLCPPLIRVCAVEARPQGPLQVFSVSESAVCAGWGNLHAVKHLGYTESLPCLNGTAASRYVEENFQRTVGFLIKA